MLVAEQTRTIFYNCLITRVVLPTADFATTATSTSTSIPTTSSTSTTPTTSPSNGLSSAAIGGIAGGIVGGFVLAGAILGFILYRRTKTKAPDVPPPVQQIDYTDHEYVGKPEPENTPNRNVYQEES